MFECPNGSICHVPRGLCIRDVNSIEERVSHAARNRVCNIQVGGPACSIPVGGGPVCI